MYDWNPDEYDVYADGTPRKIERTADAARTPGEGADSVPAAGQIPAAGTGTENAAPSGVPGQDAGAPYGERTAPAADPRKPEAGQEGTRQADSQQETGQPHYSPYRFDSEWQRKQIAPTPYRENREKKKGERSFGKKIGICAFFAILFGLAAGLVFAGMRQIGTWMEGRKETVIPEERTEAAPEEEKSAPKVAQAGSEKKDEADDDVRTVTPSDVAGAGNTVADVAEITMPAMVAITKMSVQQVYSFFGESTTYEVPSAGTGIIVGQTDDELLIATNEHVISKNESLSVCFVDDTAVEAYVKGEDSKNDLAIVSVALSDIPEDTLDAIRIITIGDSDAMRIGEQVVAIGNALGYGQSVSAGVISALNREVTVDDVTHTLMQTDAAINPGNSGGALLNMNGELIGINEVKYVSEAAEGIGYAIPITQAMPILNELMNRETRTKVPEGEGGFLGITCNTVTEQYSSALNIPVGAYVESVTEGGAADKAGIMTRDIITGIEEYDVSSADDLVTQLKYYRAGDTVTLKVARINASNEYEEISVDVKLGKRPADLDPADGQEEQDEQYGNNERIPFDGEEDDGEEKGNGLFPFLP